MAQQPASGALFGLAGSVNSAGRSIGASVSATALKLGLDAGVAAQQAAMSVRSSAGHVSGCSGRVPAAASSAHSLGVYLLRRQSEAVQCS